MQLGDAVIWADDLDKPVLRRGTVTKINNDTCWLDNKHKGEDARYIAFMWPATVEQELLTILTQRQSLKKALDDSMSLIYQLRNRITRGEIG